MFTIYKKEMRTYFTTWIGYIFLLFFVLPIGLIFSLTNLMYGSPTYVNILNFTLTLFLFLIPMLTMRLFSDEIKNKTDQLLFTAPISITDIVLGKFFAALTLFLVALGITLLFPAIIIFFGGKLPMTETISSFIGYILLVSCFISIGVFISSKTENQIVSALITFTVLFVIINLLDTIIPSLPTGKLDSIIFLVIIILFIAFLLFNSTKNIIFSVIFSVLGFLIIIIMYIINSSIFTGLIYKILSWFSLLSRYDNFTNGIFSLSDIIYYITFTFGFLYLTINSLEKRRWK